MNNDTKRLINLIKNNDEYALGSLMAAYSLQGNNDSDKIKFNQQDSDFLFALAEKNMRGFKG